MSKKSPKRGIRQRLFPDPFQSAGIMDASEENNRSLQKKILVTGTSLVAMVGLGAVVLAMIPSQSEFTPSANATSAPPVVSSPSAPVSLSVPTPGESRYDDGIVENVPAQYTTPSGVSITGAYKKANYQDSVTISKSLAQKYVQPFTFYYIVGESQGIFYVTSASLAQEGRVFEATISANATSDNLMAYLPVYDSQMQQWADLRYGGIPGVTHVSVEPITTLTSSKGFDMRINSLQSVYAPSITVFRSTYNSNPTVSADDLVQFVSMIEPPFTNDWSLTVVTLDGAPSKTFRSARYNDYASILDSSGEKYSVQKFTVSKDGKIGLSK